MHFSFIESLYTCGHMNQVLKEKYFCRSMKIVGLIQIAVKVFGGIPRHFIDIQMKIDINTIFFLIYSFRQ